MNAFTGDLFELHDAREPWIERLSAGTVLLHGFATADAAVILADLAGMAEAAPFRHMMIPGGRSMSVAMTNCGALGWVADTTGYRYARCDPQSSHPWPAMPDSFSSLARTAASEAGFANFMPDACLINRYAVGARMSLHQDKDERDFNAPIVSVSLGLPAVFFAGWREASGSGATSGLVSRGYSGLGWGRSAALSRRIASQGGLSHVGWRCAH